MVVKRKRKGNRRFGRAQLRIKAKETQIKALLSGRNLRDEEIGRLRVQTDGAMRLCVLCLEKLGGRLDYTKNQLQQADTGRFVGMQDEETGMLRAFLTKKE